MTGSGLRKEYDKAVYCHPVCLTYMQSTSCKMLGWMKPELESRLPGEISITSEMQMTPLLMAPSEEELKNFLMRVKEKSEKPGLKLNIKKKKIKIMASSPITSWQIEGENVETVKISSSWALKSLVMVTADMKLEDDCFLVGKL